MSLGHPPSPSPSPAPADWDKEETTAEAPSPGDWASRFAALDLPSAPSLLEILGSLRQVSRSPLRDWGVRRRSRWFPWLCLAILWVGGLAVTLVTVGIINPSWFHVRPTFASLLRSQYGLQVVYGYLCFMFAGAVLTPLLLLIPWKTAMRFHEYWRPWRLRELILTRFSLLDIFWGVVAPPIRSLWFVARRSSEIYLIAGILFSHFLEGRFLAYFVVTAAILLEVAFLGGIFTLLMTLGYGQRARGDSSAVYVFGLVLLFNLFIQVLIVATAGFLLGGFQAFIAAPFVLPFLYAVPLFAAKSYAFNEVRARLANRASE